MKLKPDIFIESNDSQACEINKKTGIPTICTDKMKIYE